MMFAFIATAVCFIISALILNRLVSRWHKERVKHFRREEKDLVNRLNSAMKRQKQALLKLQRLKGKIRNYEAMLPKDYSPDNSDD